MIRRFVLMALVAPVAAVALAAQTPKVDVTGKWKSSFDTQIGVQNYTYDFVVKEGVLTGKATSDLGESALTEGKVTGDTVTFHETLSFQGMDIAVVYTGKITSADEIKFTRQVGEFATEELVAKRVK